MTSKKHIPDEVFIPAYQKAARELQSAHAVAQALGIGVKSVYSRARAMRKIGVPLLQLARKPRRKRDVAALVTLAESLQE